WDDGGGSAVVGQPTGRVPARLTARSARGGDDRDGGRPAAAGAVTAGQVPHGSPPHHPSRGAHARAQPPRERGPPPRERRRPVGPDGSGAVGGDLSGGGSVGIGDADGSAPLFAAPVSPTAGAPAPTMTVSNPLTAAPFSGLPQVGALVDYSSGATNSHFCTGSV